MIHEILTRYTEQLNEYLVKIHNSREEIAAVGQIGAESRETPNKLIVSLLNIERETSGGISATISRSNNGSYAKMHPPLMLILNVILAAVYDSGRYDHSLSVLSDALAFIQANPKFEAGGKTYTVEVVNCTMQYFNNIWTLMGSHSYPSVVCKIRNLVIDSAEMVSSGKTADKPVVNTNSVN